jgi:hypothetical protein
MVTAFYVSWFSIHNYYLLDQDEKLHELTSIFVQILVKKCEVVDTKFNSAAHANGTTRP